jgi:hypothetical protein
VLAFFGIVCIGPLRLGGLRGKKTNPRVGWEVPMRSQRFASWSGTEHECGTTTVETLASLEVHTSKFHNFYLVIAC